MNQWKIATFVLIGVLAVTVISSYKITCDALRAASAANGTEKSRRSDLERAQLAVSDAQGFINFFRMNDDVELSEEDYQRQVKILTSRYLRHYPNWASTLGDGENLTAEPESANGG